MVLRRILSVSRLISIVLTKLYTRLLRRRKNIEIGKNSYVYYRSAIVNKSKLGGVKIGSGCTIGRRVKGYHAGMPFYTTLLNDGNESHITIGDKCRMNGVYIHAHNNIVIGNNCVFAAGISIIDSNGYELYSKDRTVGHDTPKPIIIGNNVWVGLNAVILKDTTIGNNSVVAAGSVVKGHYPENSVIQGNPAVVVKYLRIENKKSNVTIESDK